MVRLIVAPGGCGVCYSVFPWSLLRELSRVPAPAERANQLHRACELAGFEIRQGALIAEQCVFGGQDFQVARNTAFVALVRHVERTLRRRYRLLLYCRFLIENAQTGEVILDVLKCLENRVPVGRCLGFVQLARLVTDRATLPGVEQQFRGLSAQGPERAGALEPGSAMRALKSARAAQADGGV